MQILTAPLSTPKGTDETIHGVPAIYTADRRGFTIITAAGRSDRTQPEGPPRKVRRPDVFLLWKERVGWIVAFRSAKVAWCDRCFRGAKGDKGSSTTETNMMTSRERVLKAVNHQTPDRVPIDLSGMKASGIAVGAYDRLKRRLGISTRTRVWDPRLMIAVVEDEVLRRLHVDVVPLDLSFLLSAARADDEWTPRRLFDGTEAWFPPGTDIVEDAAGNWILRNADGSLSPFKMPKGGYYFDDTSFNRGSKIDPKIFRPVDDVPDEDLETFSRCSRSLYEETDYAILGWGYGVCFLGLSMIADRASNVAQGLPDQWMMMLMTEKETCHEMMDQAVEATIKCLSLASQAVGDRCFAWGIAADDSGTQRGEFIRPDLWAEMLKPHYKKLCDWIHSHTSWKTFLHSCGSVRNLMPHFIEAGIDILNPVQTSAANMDPAQLKREFGDHLVFWGGGCDTQRILGGAGPDEIRQHVKDRIGTFSPGGGYVFNQIHNIQTNVPPENIVAMFDAAYEYGVSR
jgi:uroporphyrinogen-III decarboxylase